MTARYRKLHGDHASGTGKEHLCGHKISLVCEGTCTQWRARTKRPWEGSCPALTYGMARNLDFIMNGKKHCRWWQIAPHVLVCLGCHSADLQTGWLMQLSLCLPSSITEAQFQGGSSAWAFRGPWAENLYQNAVLPCHTCPYPLSVHQSPAAHAWVTISSFEKDHSHVESGSILVIWPF